MDKYEYKVRSEEISKLIDKEEYAEAMKIADTIDWRRVKSATMLLKIAALYRVNRRLEDSRAVLMLAYERYPTNRSVVYSLCEVSIELNDVVAAIEHYKQYMKLAPKENGVYILRYRILEISEASLEERIEILEELKKRDYQEEWAYELAYLYHRVGLSTKCVEECDDIVLWFGDGPYVMKAMELKKLHMPLTEVQQAKYNAMLEGGSENSIGESGNEENYSTEDYNAQIYDTEYANQNIAQIPYNNTEYTDQDGYAGETGEYTTEAYGQNDGYGTETYSQDSSYNENAYGPETYLQNNGYDENIYGPEMYPQNGGYDENTYGAETYPQNSGYDENIYGAETYPQNSGYDENAYESDVYAQNNNYDENYPQNNNIYGSEAYTQNDYSEGSLENEAYVQNTGYDESAFGNGIYAQENSYHENTNQNEVYASQDNYNENTYEDGTYATNNTYNQSGYTTQGYEQNGYVDDGYGNLSYIDNTYQDGGYTGEFYVEQIYDTNGNLMNPNPQNNAYANSVGEGNFYGNSTYENNNYGNAVYGNDTYENDVLKNIAYKSITPVQDIHSDAAVVPAATNSAASDMSQYNTINLQKVVAESMKEIFPDDDAFEEEQKRINAEELAKGDSTTNTIIYGNRAEIEKELKDYTKEPVSDIEDEIFDVRRTGFTSTGRVAQIVTGVSEIKPDKDTGAIKKVIVPGDNARIIKEEPDKRKLWDTTERTVDEEHARMENKDENVYHEKNIFEMHLNTEEKPNTITGKMRLKEVLEEWEQKKLDNAKRHQEEIKQHVLTQTGRIFAEFDNSIKSGILGELEREEEENRKRSNNASDRGFLEADVTSDLPEMQDKKTSEEKFDVEFVSEKEKEVKLQEEQKVEYITELERAVARELGMQTKEISRLELFEAYKKKLAEQHENDKPLENHHEESIPAKNSEEELENKQQEEAEIPSKEAKTVSDTYEKVENKQQEEAVSQENYEETEIGTVKQKIVSQEDSHEIQGSKYEEEDNSIKESYEETATKTIEQQEETILQKDSYETRGSKYEEEDNSIKQAQEETKRIDSLEDIYKENNTVFGNNQKSSRNLETKRIDDIIRSGYIAAQSVIHHGQIEPTNSGYIENSFVRNRDLNEQTVQLNVNEVIGRLHETNRQAKNNSVQNDKVESYQDTGSYSNDSYSANMDETYFEDSDIKYNGNDIHDVEYQEPVYDARARYERDMEELDPEDAESIAEMAKEDALKTQEIKMNTADLSTLSDKIVATTRKEATGARREEIRDFTVQEQTLFENFAVTKKIKKQIIYALDNMTLAAYTGNVIITGDAGIDTVRMAKNLMKVYQDYDGNFSGKAAKITGEKLNQRNLKEIFAKLNNGGIIIEKANGMSEEKLYEMSLLLNQESLGIVVIMEDTKKEITKLLEKQAMIVDYFNIRIDLMEMDNNALVAYAKNYALALEYSIDDLGILALYTRISNMQSGNHVVTKDEVRDIIDEAIYKSKKSKIKNFVDVLFARRYDNEDMIVLKERDFI